MIIARAPLRIPLGGGGTDLKSYYSHHGGFILSAAINKYVYIYVNHPAVDQLIRPPGTSRDFCAAPLRLPSAEPTDPRAPGTFRNQPHPDFSRRENRDAYDAALFAAHPQGLSQA